METFIKRMNSEMFRLSSFLLLSTSFFVFITHMKAESSLSSKLSCNLQENFLFLLYIIH